MLRRTFLKQTALGLGSLAVISPFPIFKNAIGQETDPIERAKRSRVFVLEHGAFWNVQKVVEILVKANANAIRCDVGIYGGLVTMYPSKYLPPHPELGNKDQLRDLVAECKKYSIRVFPYNAFYHSMSPQTRERFPGWAMRNSDGSDMDYACQNNPHFVQTFCNACKEIVQNYDVAGMYFDGPGELQKYQTETGFVKHPYCHCEYCQKVFKQKFGSVMPSGSDLEYDPVFRNQMLEVHIHGMEFIMAETSKAIKSVRNIPVLMNACDPVRRFIRHRSMQYTDGALMAEIHRTCTYMEALTRTKVGTAFRKAAWCYCPIGPHEGLVSYDDLETKIFGLTQLAHGATPIIETLQSYLYDTTGLASIKELFTHMQRNEELYTSFTPVPHVALLISTVTAQRFSSYEQKNRSGHWDNSYFCGAFTALTHAHQQFNVLLDQDINSNDLEKYRVLFLPNITCLSDAQIEAIKKFVQNGGGLIATHHTSLFDENGKQRNDFALKDLFNASYQSDQNPKSGRFGDGDPYLYIDKEHSLFAGIPQGKFIYCERQTFPVVTTLEGGEAIAQMYLQNVGETFNPIQFSEASYAGIIVSTYGKGRILYIAPPLDLIYRQREFRLVRQLISDAVDWVTFDQSPVKIHAPICVTANITENKTQRALHLINYTGNRQENLKAKVEWVAPLRNLEISFMQIDGKKLTKASLLVQNRQVPFTSNNGYDFINLPNLEEYEALLLDYMLV